jgi:hypothetical protein
MMTDLRLPFTTPGEAARRAVAGPSPKEESMRHWPFVWTFFAVIAVIAGGIQLSHVAAQEGTPAAGSASTGTHTMVLVERDEHHTVLDLGEPGSSVGDMLVWGPNALYDENNTTDTGAVSAGTCVAFTADFDCVLVETVTFPDGSTLQFQAAQPSAAAPYLRTIVGGSGAYLGATGTAEVAPRDDGKLWTRTIEVRIP